MHGMFEECNIPFARHYVIDNRMEASHAMQLIHEASCVFLMGGHPGLQLQLIRDKGLDVAICGATAAVLGVSAGAICAMEDNSAIFVAGDHISYTGLIHWVSKGKICPLSQGSLLV